MESTRRLSLTLLLVTPIIAARRLSSEDLGLGGVPSWGGLPELQAEPAGDLESSTEPSETYGAEVYDEGYSDFGSWLRRKRALDSPGDDLETAEQVLFRPTFRYKNLVKEREKSHRLREELRRQFSQNSPVPASSSPSVASLPPSTAPGQRKYYNSYPQPNQRVYTPRAPTAQRIYSPQIPPSRIVPNYQQIVQNPSQYPRNLVFTQHNQGYRPQRSPYAYLYPQRLN